MSPTMNLPDELTPTIVVRSVQFVCPLCGEDRTGTYAEAADGSAWVDCEHCTYRCDPGVLEVPTEAELAEWRAQARRHGRIAVRCADGTPTCSYLAIVWCRRLAPELSLWGKVALLDDVARPMAGELTNQQREVLLQLGVALHMPASAINEVLTAV